MLVSISAHKSSHFHEIFLFSTLARCQNLKSSRTSLVVLLRTWGEGRRAQPTPQLSSRVSPEECTCRRSQHEGLSGGKGRSRQDTVMKTEVGNSVAGWGGFHPESLLCLLTKQSKKETLAELRSTQWEHCGSSSTPWRLGAPREINGPDATSE